MCGELREWRGNGEFMFMEALFRGMYLSVFLWFRPKYSNVWCLSGFWVSSSEPGYWKTGFIVQSCLFVKNLRIIDRHYFFSGVV